MTAHGIDIAEGIGGGNLSIDEGVVHRGGDEIGRGHQGQFLAEPVYSGIITGIVAYQEIFILRLGKTVKQGSEPDRVDFGRSAAGLRQVLQGRFSEVVEYGHGLFKGDC